MKPFSLLRDHWKNLKKNVSRMSLGNFLWCGIWVFSLPVQKHSGGGLTSCTAAIHKGATETFQQVKLKWQSSYVYTSQRCRTAWGCAAARRLKSVRPVGRKQTTGPSVEIRERQQTRLLLWCKKSSGVAVNWQPTSLPTGVAANTKTHADVPDTSESYLGKCCRGDLLFQRLQKNIPTVDPAAARETQTGSGKYAQVSLFPVNNQPHRK